MSEVMQDRVIDNIRDIDKNGTLLDILLEFERVLDEVGLYAYKNWRLGEIVEGPKLARYWLHVKLMYPYQKMPDPKAGMRLLKLGCEVKFEKGIMKEPVVPKSPEELDAEGKLVDEFKDEEISVGGSSIDTEELNNAYEGGLDDDTNKRQDI